MALTKVDISMLEDAGATGQVLTSDGTNWTSAAGHKILQVVSSSTGEYYTGTTRLPSDNTIPQITEGVAWTQLDRTITPASSSNKLLFVVNVWLSSSVANANISTALFKSGTASALSSGFDFVGSTGRILHTTIIHYEAAGATSQLTFQVRSGTDQASTTRLNGDSSREHGGTMESSLTIWEIEV